MNGNIGISKKSKGAKLILRDAAYSSTVLERWTARPAAKNQRNHITEEQFNDFCFINP